MKELGVYPTVDESFNLMPQQSPYDRLLTEESAWGSLADFWREQAKIWAGQEKAWHEVRLFCQKKKIELPALLK